MFIKRLISMIMLAACLQVPVTQAATVDGDPGVDMRADTGLYVWRDNGGTWQMRLVSGGTQSQQFLGTFTSNQAISQVTNVSVDGHDAVFQSTSSTLTTSFTVYQGGLDGVSFATTQSGGLCLRDSSGGVQTVYLGANAAAVTTPVDLTESGACGNGGGSSGSSTVEGLQITRLSNQDWQVRQVSVSNAYQFSGNFEATANFSSFQNVSLESSDSASYSASNVLSVAFETWPGGTDGVNFSIPASAGVCLRASTSMPVYLDDVRVTFPVDLAGNGACTASGGGTTGGGTTGGGGTVSGGRHPGHYLGLMRGNDSQSTMSSSIKAGMQGFMKRYTWRELEPTLGNYDFSEVRSDLDFVASQGLHLIVMIEDKTFTTEYPMPAYLQGAQYMRANRKGGYSGIRWNAYVNTRFKALVTALANRFDGHAAFEGLIPGEETAPGLDDPILDATGYTPEIYRDVLIDSLTSAARAMPNSTVFWYMNFLPRKQDYIGVVAEAVRGEGVVMGGPDVLPDDSALVRLVYPFYLDFKNKMDLFGQVEPSCYNALHEDTSYPTKYWTMPELFRYARDTLGVKYMFWMRWPGWGTGGYSWQDALPVMANNPAFNQ